MCYEGWMNLASPTTHADTRDLETFGVGQIVSILDIADLQDLEIQRISDSGVYAVNSHHRKGVMLSCGSPARLTYANSAALEKAREVMKAEPVPPARRSVSRDKRFHPANLPAPVYAPATTIAQEFGLISYRSKTA